MRENPPRLIYQSTRSACAAGVFVHHARVPRWAWDVLRRFGAGRKRAARTLSRDFWQQKNFHNERLRVSSVLAKTGFLGESPALIRASRSRPIARRRASPLMVNDRCKRAPACGGDAAGIDNARFKGRAWPSADRSQPADWPCRQMTSSPGRRTSRSVAVWRGLGRPCRDWPR